MRARRKWLLLTASLVVIVALLVSTAIFFRRSPLTHPEAHLPAKPEAPPDLQKLRNAFISGIEAVGRNDGADAVRHLASFRFGSRQVEEYRLYYLANGYQLSGKAERARETLAALWRRNPRLVYAEDAGFNLAGLHIKRGAWGDAAAVYSTIASRTENPAVAAAARWREIESRMAIGDVGGVASAARLIVVRSPRAPQAGDSIALLRSVEGLGKDNPLRLTAEQRLERAAGLMRDGDSATALEELTVLQPVAPAGLQGPVQLNRGLALHKLRRFEDSTRTLEPLTSGYYKYAIPALYHLAKNYRILSDSIDPTVTKAIVQKKKVGTVKVWVGKGKKRRTVTRPKYTTVKKAIKLVDLAKKAKKEEYARLSSERLKDMLLLPLADAVRVEALNTLASTAESKNQDAYLQELVPQIVKLDPLLDPGLQHLWDKAWAAYTRGDLGTARSLLRFIADTYANTNVKRQAEYWYARTVERQGEKEEAAAIYRKLAEAPYADLYALHAEARGAKRRPPSESPLKQKRPDWGEIAEKEMPSELRLAYELTALSDFRDARLEIQRNMQRENQRYAEALLAEIYNSTGSKVLMYRSIRRAWPLLATVEQDSVPPHFIQMYYPVHYEDAIRKYAQKQGVDPYLVMGLILQESYFDPRARSAVGATGLMQIMPPTGKEIAQRLRVPFGASRLENPDVNVQLGTYHLRMLINMFGGNPYLAVASYNGGQGNVLRWRRAARGKPLDEFLESIPFPETRNYVKRVTILRSAYERIAS